MLAAKEQRLFPILKYPGGKEKELVHILPNLPPCAHHYYEPFVGGGAVFFAVNSQEYYINDKSSELMTLYRLIKDQDREFLNKVAQIDHNWKVIEEVVKNHSTDISNMYIRYKTQKMSKQKLFDEISSFVLHNANEFNGLLSPDFNVGIQNFVNELIKSFKNKIIRMTDLEKTKGELSKEDFLLNAECAFKSAFYMHFRYLYNHAKQFNLSTAFHTAIYFYIREFCYSSMFRYNASGQFNVPYGGISYNRKSLLKKLEYFSNPDLVTQLRHTTMCCEDFESFLNLHKPSTTDFMFLDPPYDTEFSTYAKNTFEKEDQVRLANYLKNDCDCYFMLVIKNTEFIRSLYIDNAIVKNGRKLKIHSFDKKYFVSFQNRNDKNAEHLIVTNY